MLDTGSKNWCNDIMSASRSKVSEGSALNVVSLPDAPADESPVSSCVMAYFSSSGEFRFRCDFKTEMERDSLILRLDIVLAHIRSRVSSQITPSLNLAA
jgi:hypothetical protein